MHAHLYNTAAIQQTPAICMSSVLKHIHLVDRQMTSRHFQLHNCSVPEMLFLAEEDQQVRMAGICCVTAVLLKANISQLHQHSFMVLGYFSPV